MDIDIRAIGFALTPALAQRVTAQVQSALASAGERPTGVTVRLTDVNGDRGGVDKRCRIVVALSRRGTTVATATAVDLYAAVDEAARRLRRSAQRSLTRHVGRERNDPQRPGTLVHA